MSEINWHDEGDFTAAEKAILARDMAKVISMLTLMISDEPSLPAIVAAAEDIASDPDLVLNLGMMTSSLIYVVGAYQGKTPQEMLQHVALKVASGAALDDS